MTERYWESQVGAIHFDVTDDTRQLLYKQRNAKLAAVGSATGKLAAKLSPVAEAMASIAPLASAGKELAACIIAQKYLQWKPMPEPAQREETKLPVFDYQSMVDRHREHERREAIETARLVEFARLRARDEYEASNRTGATPRPAPLLKLVESHGIEADKTAQAKPMDLTPTPAPAPAIGEPPAPPVVAASASDGASWAVVKPQRLQGYGRPLYDFLKAAHAAGRPIPKARDVLEAWREKAPPEVAKVLADSLDHYNAKGDTKAADLEAIRKAIGRMTR